MVGLEGAGKTTILSHLKKTEIITSIIPPSLYIETTSMKKLNANLTVFDLNWEDVEREKEGKGGEGEGKGKEETEEGKGKEEEGKGREGEEGKKGWRDFLEGKEALIFNIDSTDRERIEETRKVLMELLEGILYFLQSQSLLFRNNYD